MFLLLYSLVEKINIKIQYKLLIYILHRYDMFSINSLYYNPTKMNYLHVVPLTHIKIT